MTTFDWISLTLAAGLTLAGLVFLFRSWKTPGRPRFLLAGWGLLAGALVIAFIANADRGVAQIAAIVMMLALVPFARPVLAGLEPPVPRERRRQTPAPDTVIRRPLRATLSGIWTFLVCGPVAGAIAVFAAAGLFKLLRPADGSPATAGIVSIMCAVLLWAVLSTLLLIEPREGRRSLWAGLALAATAAVAFIG